MFVLPQSHSAQLFSMLWGASCVLSELPRRRRLLLGLARVSSPRRQSCFLFVRAYKASRTLVSIFFESAKNRQPVESKTLTYHGRVVSGQHTAGRRGRAGRGRTGRRRVGSPRRRPTLLPARASRTPVLNVSSEARTNEIT